MSLPFLGLACSLYKDIIMPLIQVQTTPSPQTLEELDIFSWPIWEKEISIFPWKYTSTETCYFLQGKVTVTPKNGEPVHMGKGDMVTFPKDLECTWEIHEAVKKHYNFTD